MKGIKFHNMKMDIELPVWGGGVSERLGVHFFSESLDCPESFSTIIRMVKRYF